MKNALTIMIAAGVLLSASAALAAPSPAQKCEASKNKLAGGYYGCRAKAEAKAIIKGTAADYSKCTAKFGTKWDSAETAGAGMCPDDIAVTADVEAFIAGQATAAAGLVAGTVAIPECGDGAVNVAGEHCDGAALDGNTCATFGLHGTLACTPGCEFDLGGCSACPASSISYEDACWVLGAESVDCNAACATLGMIYDDATLTVAGSAGTDANCTGLLHLTGAPGGELDNAGGDCSGSGLGCAVLTEFGFRARCGTPATDASTSSTGIQRVCACQ
ncbi:MAG: hypothetical protein ABR587_07245 [Candidatus Binatia bacterium]